MIEKLVLSIALVLCFGTCFTTATDKNEMDVGVSQTERIDYFPVDIALNKKFNFNKSEFIAPPEDECECKNGKCMQVCDKEKTTPCEDQKKVCVCNPGYAKNLLDDKCQYCNCGGEINCTFRASKVCDCPDGYAQDYFSQKCKLKCSEELPCQNGGTCDDDNLCWCPPRTSGDLCQNIEFCSDKCLNSLEVDCNIKREYNYVTCSCKNSSLYWIDKAGICMPCDCENGYCEYHADWIDAYEWILDCNCNSGYIKFNGHCKKCECGASSRTQCEVDENGEKICRCFDGFYAREGQCHICGCNSLNDTETKCEVTGNEKRCFCKEGFQNVFGHCEDIDECETNNTCHPSATCINLFGSFRCECPNGYWGTNYSTTVEPGEVCVDIDECLHNSSVCASFYNVKCVNIPGSYKCECLKGYVPNSLSEKPYSTSCSGKTIKWRRASIALGIILSVGIIGVGIYMYYLRKGRNVNLNFAFLYRNK